MNANSIPPTFSGGSPGSPAIISQEVIDQLRSWAVLEVNKQLAFGVSNMVQREMNRVVQQLVGPMITERVTAALKDVSIKEVIRNAAASAVSNIIDDKLRDDGY